MKKLRIYISIVSFFFFYKSFGQDLSIWKKISMHQAPVTSLLFHGNKFFSGDKSGILLSWEIQTNDVKFLSAEKTHQGEISHIEVSPDGKYLVTAAYDGKVCVFDYYTMDLLKSYKSLEVDQYDGTQGKEMTFAVFSPDSESLYIGGYNRSISKIDLNTDKKERIYYNEDFALTCASITPDKKHLAFGLGGQVQFLDLKHHKISHKIIGENTEYEKYVCEITFIPKHKQLALWTVGGKADIYSSKGKFIETLNASSELGSCTMAATPGGETLYCGNTNDLKNFNLKSNKLAFSLHGHKEKIQALGINSAGNILASASTNNNLFIWKSSKITHNLIVKDQDLIFHNKHLKVGESFVLNKLQFEKSSYKLLPEAKDELKELLEFMNLNKSVRIALEGHTSNEGDAKKNLLLSKRRIEVTKNYLIHNGINENRIEIEAFGESKPLTDNSTEASRKANRRIEMRILKI